MSTGQGIGLSSVLAQGIDVHAFLSAGIPGNILSSRHSTVHSVVTEHPVALLGKVSCNTQVSYPEAAWAHQLSSACADETRFKKQPCEPP